MPAAVQPIVWARDHLRLLDQRVLPGEVRYLECRSAAEVADAIHAMAVRGAPAIGIAAAYGLVLAVRRDADAFDRAFDLLAASRPTAVNLRWALERMRGVWLAARSADALEAEAVRIHEEDLAQNLRMGELGADLIASGARVITHCNTGALATGGHGTALGVIRSAHARHHIDRVYHTETRPWLQGARLTAWELQQEGIPAKLIIDGAAAHLMSREKIDWVIVGADRIAANGDTANKIGTYALAVAAKRQRRADSDRGARRRRADRVSRPGRRAEGLRRVQPGVRRDARRADRRDRLRQRRGARADGRQDRGDAEVAANAAGAGRRMLKSVDN
jgi:methylthioribose-1-phosphate isomerase